MATYVGTVTQPPTFFATVEGMQAIAVSAPIFSLVAEGMQASFAQTPTFLYTYRDTNVLPGVSSVSFWY